MFELSIYPDPVGRNKRYADWYDRQMSKHITEMLVRPAPITLSPAELNSAADPVESGDPVPVRAWVRYPETPARIEGRAVAWTSRAVQVEWENAQGQVQRAWVWASAVDRL